MKAFKIKTLLGALMLVLCLPLYPAEAYEVTDTSATRLTPEYSLFTITYRFGFLNRESLIPMDAVRGGSRGDTSVGFALTGANGTTTAHLAQAVVLSKAELRGREYYIPRGKNADFTLVAIVKTQDVSALGAAVTRLPFTLIDDRVSLRAGVTGKDLATYKTELLPALISVIDAPVGK